MKIRFYSINDLYEEVKDLKDRFPWVEKVVRMQFLETTYSQEFKGGGESSFLPMTEQTLTLTVVKRPSLGEGTSTVYYYSQPFYRCIQYEVKDKESVIFEKLKDIEDRVKETFADWTVKRGIYEDD